MKANIVEAIQDAMRIALARDKDVVVLGEDVGKNGGVFRATDGLQAEFGESRVFDTPLAESSIAGVGVGLAAYGLRPICEVQFGGFLYISLNQIASQAARLRLRTSGRLQAGMVIRAPYGGNVRTPDLHSDSLEALFAHTPGVKVAMPSTPYNAKGMLLAAIDDPDPVVFLEPMRIYRGLRAEIPDGHYTVPLGEARIAREGQDVTVVAYGAETQTALEAAELLASDGIFCEVVDLQTISPLDAQTILASVAKTGRAVVVHEAVRQAGMGAEIAALIQEQAFYSLAAPVQRVTGWNTPFPFVQAEHLYVPGAAHIAQAVRRALRD
ncbi:MAG: alpha-ketoacid dehydrogenase subunit beta [Thermaerobacter sp.]|nr:alpha-ketoacid dehydrogenase subunit beta [Thermaerobacter sp.]